MLEAMARVLAEEPGAPPERAQRFAELELLPDDNKDLVPFRPKTDDVVYVRLMPPVESRVRELGERLDLPGPWSASIGYVLRALKDGDYAPLPAGDLAHYLLLAQGRPKKAPISQEEKALLLTYQQDATNALGVKSRAEGGSWGRATDSQIVLYAMELWERGPKARRGKGRR